MEEVSPLSKNDVGPVVDRVVVRETASRAVVAWLVFIGLAAAVALIVAIAAKVGAEEADAKATAVAKVVETKADKTWVVAKLETKADKTAVAKIETKIRLLAERSIVDELIVGLNNNNKGDAGREVAISNIRRLLGTKADEDRVSKMERKLRLRIRDLTTDVEALKEAARDREGGVSGPTPEKHIIQ